MKKFDCNQVHELFAHEIMLGALEKYSMFLSLSNPESLKPESWTLDPEPWNLNPRRVAGRQDPQRPLQGGRLVHKAYRSSTLRALRDAGGKKNPPKTLS